MSSAFARIVTGSLLFLGAVPVQSRLASQEPEVRTLIPSDAAAPSQAEKAFPANVAGIVTTRQQATINGQVLKYRAHAGHLPIIDHESGAVHAHIFFTAYTVDPGEGKPPRPLTFLWNGGPGASSSLVHLLGFGPRRVAADGTLVDNQGTWLDQTDLVFVDPVGTGYSRPTKVEHGPEFFQTRGDAESVAEFIRLFRNRFQAWDAPLFIGGESFGVTRAAGVAEILDRKRIPLEGVILISLDLPLGDLSLAQRAALMLPTYTAAAFANKKLGSDLQGDLPKALQLAEAFAESEYAPALAERDKLSEAQRQRIMNQLAKFTGLNYRQLDPKALHVGMEQFSVLLLADRNQVVGHYDTRLVGTKVASDKQYDPTQDPSLKGIINDIGVLRYFRNELKFQCDLLYQGPFGGGYPPPVAPRGDWMSVRWAWTADDKAMFATRGSTPTPVKKPNQPLRQAMIANPKLQVLMASGIHDLICSYAANAYLASKLNTEFNNRIFAHSYQGGHAIYTDLNAQQELKRDVAKFIHHAIAEK